MVGDGESTGPQGRDSELASTTQPTQSGAVVGDQVRIDNSSISGVRDSAAGEDPQPVKQNRIRKGLLFVLGLIAALLIALYFVFQFLLDMMFSPQEQSIAVSLEESGTSSGFSELLVDTGVETQLEQRALAVYKALEENDVRELCNQLSPSMQKDFPLVSFEQAEQVLEAESGKMLSVEELSAPAILTEEALGTKFADARVKIVRERSEAVYLTRFILEDGVWWLFGSSEE